MLQLDNAIHSPTLGPNYHHPKPFQIVLLYQNPAKTTYTMAAATIHTTANIEQPTSAQEHFTDGYNLDHPIEAIHEYARCVRSL